MTDQTEQEETEEITIEETKEEQETGQIITKTPLINKNLLLPSNNNNNNISKKNLVLRILKTPLTNQPNDSPHPLTI